MDYIAQFGVMNPHQYTDEACILLHRDIYTYTAT